MYKVYKLKTTNITDSYRREAQQMEKRITFMGWKTYFYLLMLFKIKIILKISFFSVADNVVG